jgi:tRNA-dihydrouridine synthase 4
MADFTSGGEERGVFWVESRRGEGIGEGVEVGSVVQPTVYGHPEDFPNGQPQPDLSHLNLYDRSESQVDSDSSPIAPHKTYYTAPPHTRLPASFLPPTKHSTLIRGSLIAQFASPNPGCLADAAELVAPYVDGLDLNCGCPQRWAYNEGIGCALLRKPELVRDMVRAVKGRLGWGWPVSVKIRVDPDLKWVWRTGTCTIALTLALAPKYRPIPHCRDLVAWYPGAVLWCRAELINSPS